MSFAHTLLQSPFALFPSLKYSQGRVMKKPLKAAALQGGETWAKNAREISWSRVRYWRQELGRNSDPNSNIAKLRESWAKVSLGSDEEECLRSLEGFIDYPLSMLSSLIRIGIIPPPELLLALAEAFEIYVDSGGAIELESAFFGPARKKSGTYARRRKKRERDMFIAWNMGKLESRGMTKIQAAEKVALMLEKFPEWGKVPPDPDSIARMDFRLKKDRKK